MRHISPALFALFFLLLPLVYSCKEATPTLEDQIEAWQNDRFGLFIHWGPVSLKGTEIGWSRAREIPAEEYDLLYREFNPIYYDAEEWVQAAKDAGMRYVVIVAKHHDGFCMWDTKYTEYNIMNTPFGRDVIRELADACRRNDMKFGIYYSVGDWYHPDYPTTSPMGRVIREEYNLERYVDFMKNQLTELIVNYGPLLMFWFDMPQRFGEELGMEVVSHIRSLQPDVMINDRINVPSDFDTPEQAVGRFNLDHPWESAITISRQWAWQPDDVVKSTQQLIHSLVRVAGGNGNLLLNVGPRPDGRIEPLQVARMRQIGDWLKRYGHAIYGTRGGPFMPTDWGVSTWKEDRIYLHIVNWHGTSPRIALPDVGLNIVEATLVTRDLNVDDAISPGMEPDRTVRISHEGGFTYIEFAGEYLQEINTIIELRVEGDIAAVTPVEVPSQSVSHGVDVEASSIQSTMWFNVTAVNNGDWVGHYWTPADDDDEPWVKFDLGEAKQVSRALLYEAGYSGFLRPSDPRIIENVSATNQPVKAFELQYMDEGEWKTIYHGGSIGLKAEISFEPVVSRYFRLLITEFTHKPQIYEIVLLSQ